MQIDEGITTAELLLGANLLDSKASEGLEQILHPEERA